MRNYFKLVCLLSVLSFLFYACNSGNVSSTNTSSSGMPNNPQLAAEPITIDSAGNVPVFYGQATKTIIYIHNNTNQLINQINYNFSGYKIDNSQFELMPNDCTSIPANSSCSLDFIVQTTSKTIGQDSALLTANYQYDNQNKHSAQLINYNVILNPEQDGVFANTSVDVINNNYAMIYLYAGGINKVYNVLDYDLNHTSAQIINNELNNGQIQSGEVKAIEVNVSQIAAMPGNQISINFKNSANKVFKSLISILVSPSGSGAILVQSAIPIIDVATITTGQTVVLNAGNSNASITAITPPTGITISGSGVNRCTTSTILTPQTSCIVYFSVDQLGGSSNISVSYTGGVGGGTQTLNNNVTWYNSIGSALLSMTVSPTSATMTTAQTATATVTVTNIGGYDISSVSIPTIVTDGSASTSVTTALSCSAGGTALPINGTCTYGITVTPSVVETNKYVELPIIGNFTTLSGSSTYRRIVLFGYSVTSAVITNQWTWIAGPNTAPYVGSYGSLNVESSTNLPPPRDSAASWVNSTTGDLYMFGGESAGNTNIQMNDLWRYRPSTGYWTWVGGSNLTNQTGVYGVQGVESAGNIPGARYGMGTWTDASGNFWLFSGRITGGSSGNYADLWRYNTSTGMWAWMNGSSSLAVGGTYGTQGVESSTNFPPPRTYMATWIDESGNLWLFGGVVPTGTSTKNDLWRYRPTTGMWTWMSGGTGTSIAAVYGTLGVESSTNMPGSKSGPSYWYTPGYFWVFGGRNTNFSNSTTNDIWRYNIANNQWTWMGGTQSTGQGALGVYGSMGVESSGNQPGSRTFAPSWKDQSGNFWLYGGSGYALTNSQGGLADLWKYNPNNGNWTWMNGSSTLNLTPTYGSLGTPSSSNTPGQRLNSPPFVGTDGTFYLFGGALFSSGTVFNDLWKINE